MGEIYRSEDHIIKKIKGHVLHEAIVGGLINSLHSPNFVKTIGYAQDGTDTYIITKYVSEKIIFDCESLEIEKFAKIIKQILVALHLVYVSFDFTHYDIYNNILISDDGTPVIIDFDMSHVKYKEISFDTSRELPVGYGKDSYPFADIHQLFFNKDELLHLISSEDRKDLPSYPKPGVKMSYWEAIELMNSKY